MWVFVQRLPRESALAIDDNGGAMPWSMVEHMLADQWEQTANRGRRKGSPWIKNPRRLEQQSKLLARRAAHKRSKFEKAKARREQQLRRTE